MKLQTITLASAAALLLTTAAQAQSPVSFLDIGTSAPTPGTLDISQLSNVGTGNDGQINFYWDNGRQNPGPGAKDGYPSESFTTGANADGYWITSLAIKTDGNGGDTPTQPESFTLAIYQLSGTSLTNAALVHTYTANGQLLTEGDWIQFNNLDAYPVKLLPSTTYAWGFGISPVVSTESWERISTATNLPAFGGQICVINDAGGLVTYSDASNSSVATFDLGLADASKAAPVPGLWAASALATQDTNGVVLWSYWGPGLTINGNAAGGADGFGILAQLAGGLSGAESIYGTPTASFFTNYVEGPNNVDANSLFGGSEGAASISTVDQFIGEFIPPVTTNYTFYLSSDDYSQLYLSTDITAAHAVLIAQEAGWSNMDQWTASAGGSAISGKDSSTFAPNGVTPQYPNGIPMVAGWKYFFMLNHQNGNGGYNDEIAYTYFGAPAPVNAASAGADNGTANVSSNLLAYVVQPPSFVTFTKEPQSTTAIAGEEATFSTAVSSDATPYFPNYQWQTNGINVTNADGTLANGQLFTYLVSTNDNNTKVQCVVTFPGANSNSYLSTAATLTITNTATLATGGLRREFWSGQDSLTALTSGNVPAPDYAAIVTNGSGPINTGINNYVERYSGWFIPPTTGDYVFFVSSDDFSDLFISTDDTPDSKYEIAQEVEYGTNYEWVTDEGGGIPSGTTVAQKSSATFLPTGAVTPPFATGIPLTAGKMYYIEADHWQGGGGDDFSTTFTLIGNVASITNGTPSAFSGANIAFETVPGTNLTIASSPFNVTVFEGNNATFQVTVATDSQIRPQYEWLVNGTNVGTGVFTNLTSTFSLDAVDLGQSGDQIQVIVTIPFTSLAATSTVATLTVQKSVFVPGFLKLQYYPGPYTSDAVLGQAEAGQIPNPEYTSSLNTFETPVNDGINDYLQIVSGYFIAPETGLYVFNVTSDDQSDLWLSTDDTAGHARLIAQENQWSNEYQYTSTAGGSTVTQKESDTWSPDPTSTTPSVPYASGIPLTQGSNYYIVAYHFQGGGGDNLGAAFWTKDGNYTLPPAGDEAVWPATNIAMLAQAATVTIVSNPVSVTVLSGTSATFSALGASDSTISVDDVTNVFVSYQWYTNGVPVAGAIGSSYTTPLLPPALTGEQVYCAISAIGAGVTNTTAATLTITKDTVPPIIESVTAILDSGGTGSESTNQYVDILFSKAMDPATLLNIANYSITGATITGVTLFTNEYTGAGSETMAILTLASPYKGSSITVNLSGITDLSGVAPTTASGSGPVDPLTSEDISLGEIDVPGSTFYTVNDGIAGYEVDASGNDIWTDNDSFRFVYTTRTNNFDVVVQVTSILPADTWTKAGLMARETIDPLDGGSRMFYDVATASTNSPVPLDGSAPENDISAGWRSATDTAAFSGTGAASNANSQAYYFIGDGVIHPTYPNQWLRMTRTGVGTTNDQFTGYASSDGQNWTLVTWIQFQNTTNGETGDFATNTPTLNTPFPDVVYVGMCTTAHITPPGLQVGVATYQDFADYVAVTKPVITAKVVTPTSLSVSWSPGGGALYSSPVLTTNTSSWTLVTTNNPAAITITAAPSMFFQVVQ